MSFYLNLLLLVLASRGVTEAGKVSKPYRLSMLALLTKTGNLPRDGRFCREAIEMVLGKVNSRRDILPDYELVASYQDEASNGEMATRRMIDFYSTPPPPGFRRSPVIVGPYFAGGCQRMVPALKYYNAISVSPGCASPLFTNHKIYGDLYKSRISGEMVSYARLKFIKDIGHWRNVALLTSATNTYDYTVAQFFLQAATEASVNIAWFDIVTDITEPTVISLRESGLRVIVIELSQQPLLIKFLCMAYKHGLSGDRYVFITQSSAYSEPTAMAPTEDCKNGSKAVLIEQIKRVYWIGLASYAIQNNGRTLLGHDLDSFERELDSRTNASRGADYDFRHRCYDTALQAVLTLNGTADLNDIKQVREAAGSVDYVGLRVGRLKYSARLEMDNEAQPICQWTPETKYRCLYEVSHLAGVDLYWLGNYEIRSLVASPSMKWPKEALTFAHRFITVPVSLFGTIFTLSAICATVQVALIGFNIHYRNHRDVAATHPLSRCLVLLGDISLDVAAVLFSLDDHQTSNFGLCVLRPILVTFGLALVHGLLVSRCWALVRNARLTKKTSSTPRNTTERTPRRTTLTVPRQTFLSTPPTLVTEKSNRRAKCMALCAVIMFLVLNLGVIICWMATDNFGLDTIVTQAKVFYDTEKDSEFDVNAVACSSPRQIGWLMPLVALNALLLIYGAFLAYQLGANSSEVVGAPGPSAVGTSTRSPSPSTFRGSSSNKRVPDGLNALAKRNIKLLRFSVFNQATLYLGAICIFFVAGHDPIEREIVLSLSCFLISLANTTILFAPLGKLYIAKLFHQINF